MKIIVYLLAIVGFLWLILVGVYFSGLVPAMWQTNSSKPACMSHGSGGTLRLDTRYDPGAESYFELIAQTTGINDKTTFLILLKADNSPTSATCIRNDRVVATTDLDGGYLNGGYTRWPVEISIADEQIRVDYTEEPANQINIANVPVRWE